MENLHNSGLEAEGSVGEGRPPTSPPPRTVSVGSGPHLLVVIVGLRSPGFYTPDNLPTPLPVNLKPQRNLKGASPGPLLPKSWAFPAHPGEVKTELASQWLARIT